MTVPVGEHSDTRIPVGGCRCSGAPHDPEGDWVELRPRLSAAAGIAILGSISDLGEDTLLIQAAITAGMIRLGIESWSFVRQVGGKSEPEPVTQESIDRLLPWEAGGFTIGSKVWDLYGTLIDPLLERRPKPSSNGRTANGTHRTRTTGSATPKSSTPSSVAVSDTKPSEVPVP